MPSALAVFRLMAGPMPSGLMSQLGQTRKSALATAMSAFPPIATKLRTSRAVRFVPFPDEMQGSKHHSIKSAARARTVPGMVRAP